MKNVIICLLFLLFIFNTKCFGQRVSNQNSYQYLDSMGIDQDSYLNQYEIVFFNEIFMRQRKSLDFAEKKVAFVTGSSGKRLSNKKYYFDLEKERISKGYSENGGTLIVFNEKQKQESGGYDVVILYWSKIRPYKKQIVELLKRNE